MLRDVQAALDKATATLARPPNHIRGTFTARSVLQIVEVSWTSQEGSRTDVTRAALRQAVVELKAAGYDAVLPLGLPWVRVMGAGIWERVNDWRDGECATLNGEPAPEILAECAAAAE